eukprot:TRINITY_DN11434_c0_g1_i1.p1 TRINITY_DN11434_c0_g1~~TRINITY_DN11434_c0_g1_i1.p1  ORF type:complete len:519 (-),score=87.71 TRINITY_DN11434_c0_g1_i1:176-1732(-)
MGKTTCTERIYDIRHHTAFAVLTMAIFPPFLASWHFAIGRAGNLYIDLLVANHTYISAATVTWVDKGSFFTGLMFAIPTGVWCNFYSTKRLMLIMNAIAILIFFIFAFIPTSIPMLVIAISWSGAWLVVALVGSLAYICRSSSASTRTTWLILYFVLNNEFIFRLHSVLRRGFGSIWPLGLGGTAWVYVGGISLFSVVLIAFPEAPIRFALGSLHRQSDSPPNTLTWKERTTKHLNACRAVVSLPAILVTFSLICAAYLAHHVYFAQLLFMIDDGNLSIEWKDGVVYGSLSVIVVWFGVLLAVSRRISDRKMLAFHAVLMVLGYLLVISYGAFSAPRFVCGAVLLSITLNVMIALGTSLFSKLIPHSFVGVWIGVLSLFERSVSAMASVWANLFSTAAPISDIPYEITLGLLGITLILMFVIYARLLPAFYSPWSGSALPTKNILPSESQLTIMGSEAKGVPLLGLGGDSDMVTRAVQVPVRADVFGIGTGSYMSPTYSGVRSPSGTTSAPTTYDDLD